MSKFRPIRKTQLKNQIMILLALNQKNIKKQEKQLQQDKNTIWGKPSQVVQLLISILKIVQSFSFLFCHIIKAQTINYLVRKPSRLKYEKHQTQVSLLLEFVSDAYLTGNRTDYMWSSTQETTRLNHPSRTTTRR